jgi:phytoene/squalene synthetase
MPDHTLDRDSADQDLAACRRLLANGSRTFLAASWLLPRAVREPACALYAFCRQADDEVDGVADPARPSPACGCGWPRCMPAGRPSAWPTARWPQWHSAMASRRRCPRR